MTTLTWSKTPTQAGWIEKVSVEYTRNTSSSWIDFGKMFDEVVRTYRSFCEWNIDRIPDVATITVVKLLYAGEYESPPMSDWRRIYGLNEVQPSVADNWEVYEYTKVGTIYLNDSYTFPEVGNDKEINLGNDAVSELQTAITSRSWFAIGLATKEETIGDVAYLRRGEGFSPLNPTLYVEYDIFTSTVSKAFSFKSRIYKMILYIELTLKNLKSEVTLVLDKVSDYLKQKLM